MGITLVKQSSSYHAANTFQSTFGMESQQQFCLKWNSFGSNLATAFGNLFKSESLTDVILFCEGVTFKAHRLILAACSKHFQDLFERAPLCPSVLVILDGTSSSNMSALLEFMYKGEVHVSQESLSSFLKAAECLQVKGLSVEHEKLAVVQGTVGHDAQLDSPTGRKQAKISSVKKEAPEGGSSSSVPEPMMHPSTSSGSGYGPVISPYMHPPHYRPAYEQRIPASAAHYDAGPRKRHHRSLSEAVPDASMRASVLRDGSKARPPSEPEGTSPMALAYRPLHPETEPAPEDKGYAGRYEGPDPAYDRTAAVDSESNAKTSLEGRHSSAPTDQGNSCPEDLRVNMELSTRPDEMHASIAAPYSEKSPETAPEIIQTNTWNCGGSSVKMSPLKGGGVQTQDGKKLQCPFCERLYGYETNLRAHIRQRHQGIRVPCPFCSRTFTRNNTVRRHIAREHKEEYGMKAFQPPPVHNHNHQ